MTREEEFLEFAADVLGVESTALSLETVYGSLPEWDSMAQLRFVTDGAAHYGVEIPFADVVKVTSLWEFYRRFNKLSSKKVVAVDLDNTLWEGVIGEEGPDGIRPNIVFLESLKSLKSRGVLLVALSKNNEEDGLEGLAHLECLTKDDFVTWRINWNEKAENLKSVAEELNLGTDAFVFVDDNPAERLKMKTLLPDVAVAEFPPNLAAYFPEGDVTEEDRLKTEEYKAESKRKYFLRNLPCSDFSPQYFAEALGIWMKAQEMAEEEATRVAQLSQKANQFNVCTNRHSEDSIRRWTEKGLVITCRAGDNFGDQGLVAFAICEVSNGVAHLMDWVMSCRVTGRGIEERFEENLERILLQHKVCELTAAWRDSGKNEPVRDLFDRLGFNRIWTTDIERRYRKVL